MDNSDSLKYLFSIFTPCLNSFNEVIVDGVKEWALIEESVSHFGRRFYYISTYVSAIATLQQALESYKMGYDWNPIYIVHLSDGRSYDIELKASLGNEISLDPTEG